MERLSVEERKKFEPNAWFVGFAPLDDPEIVVTVIVQRGGSGSAAASPLAGKILQHYYEHNHPKVPEDQGMVLAAAP
jgi:cell division protein FtsI/penicillin-binding protein 2